MADGTGLLSPGEQAQLHSELRLARDWAARISGVTNIGAPLRDAVGADITTWPTEMSIGERLRRAAIMERHNRDQRETLDRATQDRTFLRTDPFYPDEQAEVVVPPPGVAGQRLGGAALWGAAGNGPTTNNIGWEPTPTIFATETVPYGAEVVPPAATNRVYQTDGVFSQRHALCCIPSNHIAILDMLPVIPTELHMDMWVCGSACCVFGQHGDVDIWLGRLEGRPTEGHYRLWARVSGHESNLLRTNEDDPEIYDAQNSVLLYKGTASDGTSVHILGALEPMRTVVDNFDISCHASAVRLLDAYRYFHPGFTHRNLVRILGWPAGHAQQTFERGVRFAKRYKDMSFWQHDDTRRCAAEALDMPMITPVQHERLLALEVSEGL